ncbi:hypothetical protein MBGDF03_01256 [Thermoplasmatales archaeon SCGC AB-540-F20]|nr:hypothetical protein MBGDF03_01256 [Thermoplasmatales archaeon SCGC AB-540-F20]
MRVVKITTMACVLLMLIVPIIGATNDHPETSEYVGCAGRAYGEIEDYELSPFAQFRILLGSSILLIRKGTITIKQESNEDSLRMISPSQHLCIAYQGTITIHFYASIAIIHLDDSGNACSGVFGHIHVEQN